MADSAQDRNQPATPKRRKEFREKGETGMSREVSTALLMFCGAAMVGVSGSWIGTKMAMDVKNTLGSMGRVSVVERLNSAFFSAVEILSPIFVILMAIAILSFVSQGGVVFSLKVLMPKFERINPLKRFKQVFFSMNAVSELLKGLIKVGILSGITAMYVSAHMSQILSMNKMEPGSLLRFFSDASIWIIGFSALGLAALAVIDRIYVRWDLEKRMKMTMQEVKDEHKEHEGDPAVKSRRRQRHREMSLNRVLSEVPKADVVVTNPTHYAVALRYDRNEDSSPRVTAKGVDEMALKIRTIARQNGVPIMEQRALARGLYAAVKVGQMISHEYFQAVAEVYAFLYRNRRMADS